MEPLVATVTRSRRLEIKGFYERKLWGELVSGGTFFTAADIERRRPQRISHMIADMSGIRLGRDGRFYSTRLSAGFSGAGCNIKTFLDNVDVTKVRVDALVLPVEGRGRRDIQGPRIASGRVRRLRHTLRCHRDLDEVGRDVRFFEPEAFVLPGAPFSGALSVMNDKPQRRKNMRPDHGRGVIRLG